MRGILLSIFAAIATILVAFGVSTDTIAARKKVDRSKVSGYKSDAGEYFALSGEFNGTLAGQITMNDNTVWITKQTSIFVVGVGRSEPGLFVSGRSVFISGVKRMACSRRGWSSSVQPSLSTSQRCGPRRRHIVFPVRPTPTSVKWRRTPGAKTGPSLGAR